MFLLWEINSDVYDEIEKLLGSKKNRITSVKMWNLHLIPRLVEVNVDINSFMDLVIDNILLVIGIS
jgi:hypothetical protein